MDQYHNRQHEITQEISENIYKNMDFLEQLFLDCNDIVKKHFLIGKDKNKSVYMIYADGLVNTQMIQDSVLHPLLLEKVAPIQRAMDQWVIESADRKWITSMDEAAKAVLSGNTMLFIDGMSKAILISSKSFPNRGVQEADQEVAMIGPKDSFNESLRTNTALIRRRIRDTRMKVLQLSVGTRSQTDVALMYLEDLADPNLVKGIKEKIQALNIDCILDSGMLQQYLETDSRTPFPQFQLTQRPDKAASGLLEGRLVLVVDNSPMVLLLPVSVNVFFQASDDYYNRWETATFARILRYGAAFLAVGLPGFYIAVANYHPEILPTPFLLALVSARQGVPFPVIVEVLLMELEFELLREAGIRLPGQLGGTIGIVGGLIVGQAAVDANLVSTIVVIVVALTAIAAFAIPNEVMTGALRLLKFFMIIMCGLWGMYGFFFGFLMIGIHLINLESNHVPYLYPTVSGKNAKHWAWNDYFVRRPLKEMILRPVFTNFGARIRQKWEEHKRGGK